MNRGIALLTLLLAVVQLEVADAKPTSEYRLTTNLSALILIGTVWPSVEYIIDGRHGLILEGAYYFVVAEGDYEVGVGYRRYFHDKLDGGFLGTFARAGHQHGETEGEGGPYNYETPFFTLGANAGRKWQWDNGMCFTARIGYGYPFTDFEWTPSRPKPEWVAPAMAALMGVDLELALGYSF